MRWTAVAWLALVGCDDFIAPTTPTDQVYAPTWVGMKGLFEDHCNECHAAEGFYPRLPSGIIDDIASEGGQLVVPGDSGASRLWRVVSGHTTDADYARMPLGRPLLPTSMADTMAAWIDAGAPLGADDPCSALDAILWYPDADGDTWGTDADPISACDDPSTDELAYTPRSGDCNDADPAFFPGAEETSCTDTNDYNCDGSVGAEDNDADGFFACEECDDSNPDVNPDAVEICNNIDDDCDRATDDFDDSLDLSTATTWFRDADSDNFGADDDTTQACDLPTGFTAEPGDCDDTDPQSNPGVQTDGPLADGVDNDCDGIIDEDTGEVTWPDDIQPLLQSNCVECHRDFGTYTFILTGSGDGFPLITPFSADDSYIFRKINGGPNIQGVQMPRGRTPLPQADIDLIETWINDGANE